MTAFRILIDECVPIAVYYALRLRMFGLEVQMVGDEHAPLKGTKDDALLEFCEATKSLFVSCDRASVPDFMRRHIQQGRHIWGVLIIDVEKPLEAIVDEIELICRASEALEWIDVLRYVPGL